MREIFLQGHILSTLVELMKSMVQWESCDTEVCYHTYMLVLMGP
jgi:hypothetical protein